MRASGLPELPRPSAIVCHDAGAANMIYSWLHALAAADPSAAAGWRILAQGPAAHLWAQRPVPGACLCNSIDEVLDGATGLLSGTGWASNLEHDARVAAQARKIHSQAAVDHWVNYRERFVRSGKTVLPDRILLVDEYAVAEAEECFPGLPLVRCANVYLEEVVRSILPAGNSAMDILYVLEPIRASWAGSQGGEFEVLDYFAERIHRLDGGSGRALRLRPHPSDPVGKYDEWIERHRHMRAELDSSGTLAEAISRAHWVVGAETFAMVVALAAGRVVVSTLPPWAPRCRLPHPQIIHLRELA